jgi:hypothetical protein
MQISPLQFEQDNIGKRIKSSKKKYTWHFAVDADVHYVELFVSSLSGKRKLLLDGNVIMQQGTSALLNFNFTVGGASCTAVTVSGQYDLEIQGKLFSRLFEALNEPEGPVQDEGAKQPDRAFSDWQDLGEEPGVVREVKGLGFEEWEEAYKKIQVVTPVDTTPKPKASAVEQDLISFEEITKAVQPTTDVQPQTAPQIGPFQTAQPQKGPPQMRPPHMGPQMGLPHIGPPQMRPSHMGPQMGLPHSKPPQMRPSHMGPQMGHPLEGSQMTPQQFQQYQLQMRQMMQFPFMTQSPYRQ